jgi:hypothetical protein
MLILLSGTLCPPVPTPSGRSAVAPFPCLHPFRFTPARVGRPFFCFLFLVFFCVLPLQARFALPYVLSCLYPFYGYSLYDPCFSLTSSTSGPFGPSGTSHTFPTGVLPHSTIPITQSRISNTEYRIPITQKQSPRNRNNCP